MVRKTSLPRLAAEPEIRLVRWGWIAWAALTVYIAARWVSLGSGDAATALRAVSVAPAAALWLLWPLTRGAGALWRWLRSAPHAAWNGSYYEFDGRQMRVLFDDDEIYIVAKDVFDVLDLRGAAVDSARVRLIAGRDGLVELPGRREQVFTERGLAAWLDRRAGENAVRFRRWFERDVVTPHRKRRAIQTGSLRSGG